MTSASVLREIAGLTNAVLAVYTLCIVAWVVVSMLLSFGIRLPYNRPITVTIDFLHDVSEPYLSLFRKLGLRAGPLDLSPIVALLALNLLGGLVVAAMLQFS